MPKVNFHIPVLLNEAIEGLNISPNGTYVDVTYGGGGHSKAILQKLTKGRLVAFDQDPDAMVNAADDKRLILLRQNFRYLKNNLRFLGIEKVDGILADLGVSSHQFDQSERGFSFRHDTTLDMRMNPNAKCTAADVVNTYSLEKLTDIFRQYAEINNAYKVASLLVNARENQKIQSMASFLEIIAPAVPAKNENQFLAKVFQSIRIEVNRELHALKEFLLQTTEVLSAGGRLVVISYHSLEDRLVKNFMKTGNFKGETVKDLYGNFNTPFALVQNKVIVPGDDEILVNNRARSAKMRVAEKK